MGASSRVVGGGAAEAGPRDLLGAEAFLLGAPENFGYMLGAMTDSVIRAAALPERGPPLRRRRRPGRRRRVARP